MKEPGWYVFILKAIWFAITGSHWVMICMDSEDLINHLQEKDFNIMVIRKGMQEYNAKSLIKTMADEIDEDDLILMKAMFEAKALEKYGDNDAD